jgi:hypothetical protein
MKTKRRFAVLLLVPLGAAFAPGCGQIEVGSGEAGGGAPNAAGQSSASASGQDAGASCAPPGDEPWPGCYVDQPCSVCASAIKNYPLYLLRHPQCESFYACDHGTQSACSSDCPKPGPADQCDGTVGNWKGCRGLGCYVCTELTADYPNYFVNHPFCISNSTCEAQYFTCSAACPKPTDADL